VQPEQEVQPQVEPEPQPVTEPQPEPVAQVQPEPEVQPQVEPEPQPVTEPQAQPVAQTQPAEAEPNQEVVLDDIRPVETVAPPTVVANTTIATPMTGVIKWYTLEEADKLCEKAPRRFFIDVYTDWCGWCKRMDKETFANPTLANYINDNFYPVKLNAESKSTILFNNKLYHSQQKTHDVAISLLKGQLGYPSFVILDENRQTLGVLKGYIGIDKLYSTLVYVGEDYFITSNDKEFQSQWPKIKEETDKKYKPQY
jgi:thioredoxin-related protein